MATKSIAWSTGSGNITLTYTGQGNGTIAVASDSNDLGSARSQTIVVQTTDGVVTQNLTVSLAACPVPIGTVLTFSYTGDVQSVALPPGQYKLQCWGALGGAATKYNSGQYAGGKGGYSEGTLSLASETTLYIFVGGRGSSSGNGGWNCGGGSSGSSYYSSGDEEGYSRMACGGGATDIALVSSTMSYSSKRNNRSSTSLLSRIIVAGGGSGASAEMKIATSSSTTSTTVADSQYIDGIWVKENGSVVSNPNRASTDYISVSTGDVLSKYTVSGGDGYVVAILFDSSVTAQGNTGGFPYTVPSNIKYIRCVRYNSGGYGGLTPASVTISHTTTSTNTYYYGMTGMAGGGTNGQGYNTSEEGKQTSAGTNGSFGFGANQDTTNYRYCSGAGGAGWYGGGGGLYSDSDIYTGFHHGGGSGFVNTSASAGNRPSGYTGIQLDSGETKAGNTSFPNTAGTGNEAGHSGNGYAKITRLS